MTCDRAQELFSDYIEGGLDRPLAASIGSHLAACHACRQEVEGLRLTWEDLEALPVVAPPPDAVLQTLAAVRREREEARQPANQPAAWLAWLRSLSPMKVAMATSLATFIVAGAIMFPRMANQPVPLGFGEPPGRQTGGGISAPVPQRQQPQLSVTFRYGPATPEHQPVVVLLQASETLRDASVSLRRPTTREFTQSGEGTMQLSKSYPLHLELPRSSTPELLLIDVTSAPSGYEGHFLATVPFERRDPKAPISVTFVDTQLKDAVRQMSEKTGRPVVIDAGLAERTVSATVTSRPTEEVWAAVLGPLNLRAVDQQGTYTVLPRQ